MIKVEKDLINIPDSLNPQPGCLSNYNSRVKATTTHQRRSELISAAKYIDSKNYNNRYKVPDIKSKLDVIYNKKCAYCESGVEDRHVEHYRPKSSYYWLAYSWDNLLISCSTCNTKKGKKFEISGFKVTFRNKLKRIFEINNLSKKYDDVEHPKLVNPEVFDAYPFLIFDNLGRISSININVNYTIDTCKLDRIELRDKRKKIINDFEEAVKAEIALHDDPKDQYKATQVLFRDFVKKSKNKNEEFLAFRKYHIENDTLNSIINKILL